MLQRHLSLWDGEALPFFNRRHCLAASNDRSEDVSFHGHTQGEWDDIEQKKVGSLSRSGLAGKDTSLDSGTIGDGLVGVDALGTLLA